MIDRPDRSRITSEPSTRGPDDPDRSGSPNEPDGSGTPDESYDGVLTRRRLLLTAGTGVGLAVGGGLYVARGLDGDAGGYTAPGDQPMLTTRRPGDGIGPAATTGSWSFDEADAVFLFVHGFNTDAEGARDQAYTAELGLAEARPSDPPPVVGYGWQSDVEWAAAKRTADANAEPLADWLTEWADDDGRPVHLLGSSLGARVTGETLRELASRGRTGALASASLLGGAIPHDSVTRGGRYGAAIDAVDAPVWNLHSENDRVLGWVYRASDRTRAVGHGGISDPDAAPRGYADVDVTDLVADHYSYFRPGEGCLPRVVEQIG